MNEFERRFIELTQNHRDLIAAARADNSLAVVEYFGYSAQLATAADPLEDGVTKQTIIPVQSDAWFVLAYISAAVILPNDLYRGKDASNVFLQITDTGSGNPLYAAPIPGGLVTGTPLTYAAGIPFLIPMPRLIPPNTNIKIEATQDGDNASNLEPIGLYVSLMGARVAAI